MSSSSSGSVTWSQVCACVHSQRQAHIFDATFQYMRMHMGSRVCQLESKISNDIMLLLTASRSISRGAQRKSSVGMLNFDISLDVTFDNFFEKPKKQLDLNGRIGRGLQCPRAFRMEKVS